MKRIVRLTESDLVKLVKKVLKEQSDPLEGWDKLKEGQKIVLKSDKDGKITSWIVDATSPNPGQGGKGTKLFLYPDSEESRKLTPGGRIEVSFFPKEMKVEMMNGMNSIVKDLINPSKKPQPTKQSIKPGPQPTKKSIKPSRLRPYRLIDFMNVLEPNKVVFRLRDDFDMIGDVSGNEPRQVIGKTDKGETIRMNYYCGPGVDPDAIFNKVEIGYGKFLPKGTYMPLHIGQTIKGDCPKG